MKILLDEGVPKVIQRRLNEALDFQRRGDGLEGIRNGALLDLMAGQFQVLITTDKNLPFQQNLKKRQISAVIIPSNDVPSVIALLSEIDRAIATISPGEIIIIS